ncbi:hypothetical protein OVA03_06505 [Asticcacaulis sp. SL142]|uniref:hypothetical protein n=1 Tax=Asticcacaulis sp. SL142 TaxID=2995155 RepID=UPI00226D288A|nr:hypothetical protein [Asticcacaulis sp. SL142]WAC49550.1 hypothetical protein OVA03_06505 [Asticcacaulis sp. SL142]
MRYPALFLLSGFMLINMSMFSTDHVWVLIATAICIVWTFMFSRVFIMGLILLAHLGSRFYLNENGLEVTAACFAVGWMLFAVYAFSLCPRCETNISTDGWSRWTRFHLPKYCTVCGRPRQGVWPLQFRLRPEPWDGQYHDEGGGPQPDLDVTEWQMHYAQERWKKKVARQAKKALKLGR